MLLPVLAARAAAALLALSSARQPSQVHLSLDPWAGGGGADWAPVVAWRSADPAGRALVRLGLAPDRLTMNASAEAYSTHPGMGTANIPFATLRGLRPDTTYFFRVGSVGGSFSRVHNLTTPPSWAPGAKPTQPWSFLAYGDLGTAPSDYEGLLGQDVNCTTNTTVNADPPGCPDVTLRQLHRREWDGARPGRSNPPLWVSREGQVSVAQACLSPVERGTAPRLQRTRGTSGAPPLLRGGSMNRLCVQVPPAHLSGPSTVRCGAGGR